MQTNVYRTIDEDRNCLSCAFFKVEDIWYDSYCGITGFTLDDYFNNKAYPICKEYKENT